MAQTLTPGLALVRLAHEYVRFGGGQVHPVEGRAVIATPDPYWSGTPAELVARAEAWTHGTPRRPWGARATLSEEVLSVLDLETDAGRTAVHAALRAADTAIDAQHLHEDDGEVWDWYWADEVEHEASDVDAILAGDSPACLPETPEHLESAILAALYHHWRLHREFAVDFV